MPKILVETTGNFQFLDPSNGNLVRHEGYTVLDQGGVVPERIAMGQIRLVAEVSDEATDADWLDTVKESDGDLDLAVASFKSEFPADGVRVEKKAGGFKSKSKETAAEKAAREAAEKEAADKAAADQAAADQAAADAAK